MGFRLAVVKLFLKKPSHDPAVLSNYRSIPNRPCVYKNLKKRSCKTAN